MKLFGKVQLEIHQIKIRNIYNLTILFSFITKYKVFKYGMIYFKSIQKKTKMRIVMKMKKGLTDLFLLIIQVEVDTYTI